LRSSSTGETRVIGRIGNVEFAAAVTRYVSPLWAEDFGDERNADRQVP